MCFGARVCVANSISNTDSACIDIETDRFLSANIIMEQWKKAVKLVKAFYIVQFDNTLSKMLNHEKKDIENYEVLDFLSVCTLTCNYQMWNEYFICDRVFGEISETMSTGDEYCDSIMKQGFVEALLMVAIAKYPDLKNDLIIAAKGFSFGSTYINAGMLRKQVVLDALDALEPEDAQSTRKATLLKQRMTEKKKDQKDKSKDKFQKKHRRTTTIWTAPEELEPSNDEESKPASLEEPTLSLGKEAPAISGDEESKPTSLEESKPANLEEPSLSLGKEALAISRDEEARLILLVQQLKDAKIASDKRKHFDFIRNVILPSSTANTRQQNPDSANKPEEVVTTKEDISTKEGVTDNDQTNCGVCADICDICLEIEKIEKKIANEM